MKYYTILLLCTLFVLGGCARGGAAPSSEAAEQAQAVEADAQEEAETPASDEAESEAEDETAAEEAENTEAAESTDESADETETDVAEAESETADAAASASALTSPLISPLPTPPAIEVTTSSTTGAISGQLIAQNTEGVYVPLSGYIIGLATLVPNQEGGDMAAAYDPANSPTTKTNEFGQFVFNEMEPGRYGLILDAVINQALLSYPEGSEEGKGSILIELEADEHIDLETLRYDSLPIHGFTN